MPSGGGAGDRGTGRRSGAGQDVCVAGKADGYSEVIETVTFSLQAPQSGPPGSITVFLLLKGSDRFQRITPLNGAHQQALLTEVRCHQLGRRETSQRPALHWLAAGTQRKETRPAPNQCPPAIPVDTRRAGQSSCRPAQPEEALGEGGRLIRGPSLAWNEVGALSKETDSQAPCVLTRGSQEKQC